MNRLSASKALVSAAPSESRSTPNIFMVIDAIAGTSNPMVIARVI